MKFFSKTTSVFLALMALLHALRLVEGWDVQMAGMTIPLWASGIFLAIDGVLAWGLWRESR